MDENESNTDAVTEEVVETDEVTTTDKPAEEPKAEKPTETLEQKAARLKRELKQTEKKLGITEDAPKAEKKTDGLDDTVLDYLDLKGVSEAEDIEVIESIMKKTGMSARDAIKDEYVIAKLASNKATREVKDATPSSTKRAGATADTVAQAVARFEKDGTMPDNFELRNKVVDALVAKDTNNAPSWHR